MSNLTQENIGSRCRSCLETLRSQKYNIYHLKSCSKFILYCTALANSQERNEYPKFICRKCYDKLNAFNEFRIMTRRSARLIAKIVAGQNNNSKDVINSQEILNEPKNRMNTPTITKHASTNVLNKTDIKDSIKRKALCEIYDVSQELFVESEEIDPSINITEEPQEIAQDNMVLETLMEPNGYIDYNLNDMEINSQAEEDLPASIPESNVEINVPFENVDNSIEESMCSSYPKHFDTDSIRECYIKIERSSTTEMENLLLEPKPNNNRELLLSKKKQDGVYNCDQCPKRFKSLYNLDCHMRTHQGLKPFQCTECFRTYTKSHHLTQHIVDVHSEKEVRIECSYEGCSKVFRREGSLKAHCRLKHSNQESMPIPKTYVCEECGLHIRNATLLKEHRYKHEIKDNFPFKCEKCNKGYSTKRTFKEHLLRHSGIKKFECQYCGMKKTTRNELRTHINYHTKEKQYPCTLCSSVFNSSANLGIHDRVVHKGIRRFNCKYCDLSFGKPDTLKHHEMRHTGEKPHECSTCGKRFIQAVALKKHQTIHEKEAKLLRQHVNRKYAKINKSANV